MVVLAVAAAGLILWAVALKRAGDERTAGIVGALGFFAAVWAGLAGLTGGAQGRNQQEQALRAQFPDEPWQWKPEWHDRAIKGGARGEAFMFGLFGLAFMGLSAPGVWAIPAELRKGNVLILLVLLFWAIGLWMLVLAWKRLRHHRRLGTLVFHPEPLPGSWGGFVGGVIHIPRGAELRDRVTLRLRNLRLTETGSGKSRRTNERVLWETDAALDRSKLGNSARLHDVPVLFQVPRGPGQPTDERDRKDRVVWRLQIEAPLVGGDAVNTSFEIPVFDRGESLEPTAGGPLLESELRREPIDYLAEAGVTETREAGVRVWRFHQPGVRGGAVMLAVMTAIFGAVAWFVPVWLIKIGFGAFALLLAAMLPGMIWQRSELRLSERELEVVRTSLRGRRVKRVARNEVGDVALKESMTSGDKRYLRLTLIGVPGVDAQTPHPHEHFQARKARFRWRKRPDDPDTQRVLRETPRFEIEVAGYLRGTRAAEQVREHLLEAFCP